MNYKTILTFLSLIFFSVQLFGQFKFVSKSEEFQLQKDAGVFKRMIGPNNTYLIEVDLEIGLDKKILDKDFYLHKFNSEYEFEKTKKLELVFDQKDHKILHSTYFNNKILIFTDYWVKKEKRSKIEMRTYDAQSLELISENILLDNEYIDIAVGSERYAEVVLSPDGTKLLVHQYCKLKGRNHLLGYCVLDADLNKISDGEYHVVENKIRKKAIVDNNGKSYFFKSGKIDEHTMLVMHIDKKEVEEVTLDFTEYLKSSLPIIVGEDIYFVGAYSDKLIHSMTGIAICKYNPSENKVVANLLKLSDDQFFTLKGKPSEFNVLLEVHAKANGNLMIVGEKRKSVKKSTYAKNPDGSPDSGPAGSGPEKIYSIGIIFIEVNLDRIEYVDKIEMKSKRIRNVSSKHYYLHQSIDNFYIGYEGPSEKKKKKSKKSKDFFVSKANGKDEISNVMFSLDGKPISYLTRLTKLSDTDFLYLNVVENKVTFLKYEFEEF